MTPEDRTTQFEPDEVIIAGERATVRWHYRFGDGPSDWVSGVNLTTVRNGVIVESLGFTKTPGDG